MNVLAKSRDCGFITNMFVINPSGAPYRQSKVFISVWGRTYHNQVILPSDIFPFASASPDRREVGKPCFVGVQTMYKLPPSSPTG